MEKREVLEAIETIRRFNTETNQIEVKTAHEGFPKKCYDTFSSFSNKYGGIIIFGIDENQNFSTTGVYDTNDIQKKISSLCKEMEPKIRCDILPLEFEEKTIVAVKIDELPQNKKPCYYKPKGLKAGSYIREGDNDELMSDYEIYALESYNDHIFEDERPTRRSSLDDLYLDQLEEYIETLKKVKPNFAKNDFHTNLKLCKLLDTSGNSEYPTLAATMIFGKYPQCFYPQLFIACCVIPGKELGCEGSDGERFIDNKRIDGTIEEMLEGSINFLRRNMKTKVIIDDLGKREDRPEYPIKALREAITNALIHRDYSSYTEGAYISVYMYEDRIEIISPGALYGANKFSNLETEKIMDSRNPTIVRILEDKTDILENRHTGITTMKRELERCGMPAPTFVDGTNYFKVTFRKIEESAPQNTPAEIENTPAEIENTPAEIENTPAEKIKRKDNLLENLLIFCETGKNIDEIMTEFNYRDKKHLKRNYLQPLIKQNKLRMTLPDKPTSNNNKYITVQTKEKE